MVDITFSSLEQLCTVFNFRKENVYGRDVVDAILFYNLFTLCSLT